MISAFLLSPGNEVVVFSSEGLQRTQTTYLYITIRISKLCSEWKKIRGNETPTYNFKGRFNRLKELSPTGYPDGSLYALVPLKGCLEVD